MNAGGHHTDRGYGTHHRQSALSGFLSQQRRDARLLFPVERHAKRGPGRRVLVGPVRPASHGRFSASGNPADAVPVLVRVPSVRPAGVAARERTAPRTAPPRQPARADIATSGLRFTRPVKRRGCVVRCCLTKTGVGPNTASPNATATENEKMALADFVFAPSSNVAESLLDAGVPERKLLRSSYGWEPRRSRFEDRAPSDPACPTFLFVGRGSVRKGVPWLLEMWERAGVKGRLLLFLLGSLEPPVLQQLRPLP